MKYTPLDKANLLAVAYGRMFTAIFKFSSWSGFFILAVFQGIGLFLLSKFYLPGLVSVLSPILSYFLPEPLMHYPQYYLALPTVYSAFDNLILGPTVWVIFSAFAIYRLNGFWDGKKSPAGEALAKARRAYLPLLLIWLIETILMIIAISVPAKLMSGFVAGSPRMQIALNAGVQMLAFFMLAFLIYAIPLIILGGKKAGSAITGSLKLCTGNFFLTYFIILIPGSLKIIFDFVLTEFSPQFIRYMNPELVLFILFAQIAAGIFINLFIYGSAVLVYREIF